MAQLVEPMMRGFLGEHAVFLLYNTAPGPFPEGVPGVLEAWATDDCHQAMSAIVRWAVQFLYMIQNEVEDPVLKQKLMDLGCGNAPTEWDRYRLGVRCSSYTLTVYDSDHPNTTSTTRKNVKRPGFLRGYAVKPSPAPTAKISDAQEDHDPYPKAGNRPTAPRLVAPIEGLPSPQSAFGMRWDCEPEKLAIKLRALIATLNSDKLTGWEVSAGIAGDPTRFEKASMKLLGGTSMSHP